MRCGRLFRFHLLPVEMRNTSNSKSNSNSNSNNITRNDEDEESKRPL